MRCAHQIAKDIVIDRPCRCALSFCFRFCFVLCILTKARRRSPWFLILLILVRCENNVFRATSSCRRTISLVDHSIHFHTIISMGIQFRLFGENVVLLSIKFVVASTVLIVIAIYSSWFAPCENRCSRKSGDFDYVKWVVFCRLINNVSSERTAFIDTSLVFCFHWACWVFWFRSVRLMMITISNKLGPQRIESAASIRAARISYDFRAARLLTTVSNALNEWMSCDVCVRRCFILLVFI